MLRSKKLRRNILVLISRQRHMNTIRTFRNYNRFQIVVFDIPTAERAELSV